MVAISPRELVGRKGRLVDVRNPDEFAYERLPNAECVPLDRLTDEATGWDRSDCVIVMCHSGQRSAQAAEKLKSLGFADVRMVEGGIQACKKAGLELIVDRRRLPIMRQVMIGAGSLSLLGLALSHVNVWLVAITWFVAAGLVFAGLTGYCPMASLLARMPWNAAASCGGKSCS